MSYDPKHFQKGKRHLSKDLTVKELFSRHKKLDFSPRLERSRTNNCMAKLPKRFWAECWRYFRIKVSRRRMTF